MSGPGGRNEVGEGNKLDGAVGGDMPEEDKPNLADVAEGSDGVDVCRKLPEWRSVGPQSTRYDKGGGGAKGRSSSFPSVLCNTLWAGVASSFPEPVTMRQILASPPFFFFFLSSLVLWD